MYLLDTDVVIWLLRGRQDSIERVSFLKDESPICLSVLTIAEIYQNIFPSELIPTEEHLKEYILFDVDQKIAKAGGLYWQQYSKKLKNLSLTDCLIAATAQINSLVLVSLNSKHFPMPDIKLLDPLQTAN